MRTPDGQLPRGLPQSRLAVLATLALTGLLLASCGLVPSSASADAVVSVRSVDSSSAVLAIMLPPGTVAVEVLRDGRPLETLDAGHGQVVSYSDHLLWPSTSFSYEVRGFDSRGNLVAAGQASLTTPRQRGAFPRLYSPTSFWNQPIARNPKVDPHSDAIVARAIVPFIAASNFVAGSNEWGKPVVYASSSSPLYSISCTKYDCHTSVVFRIPRYALPSSGTDHHLAVIDPSTNRELDMWIAQHDSKADEWSAGDRYITDAAGWGALCSPGQRCGSAVAAGFAVLGGIVRPEEIAQGHIDHALFFTTPMTRRDYLACPATHTDGRSSDPNAIPEGARIQLDPAFSVDDQPWPRWEKVLAHALQDYGAYVGDTGQSLSLSAEATLDRGYDAWALAGVPPLASLAQLPWSHMRVLQIKPC